MLRVTVIAMIVWACYLVLWWLSTKFYEKKQSKEYAALKDNKKEIEI